MDKLHIVEDIPLDRKEWRSYMRGLRLVASCRTFVLLDFYVYLHMFFCFFYYYTILLLLLLLLLSIHYSFYLTVMISSLLSPLFFSFHILLGFDTLEPRVYLEHPLYLHGEVVRSTYIVLFRDSTLGTSCASCGDILFCSMLPVADPGFSLRGFEKKEMSGLKP